MAKIKWYGSVDNRIEEGHNFTGRELQAGDDITMYMWSDRYCYWIEEVIDQKRIKVRRYYVCADHEKATGMGHQEWMYFKTWDEENEYLCKFFPDHHKQGEHRDEPEAETWVFRNNKWKREFTHTNPDWIDNKTQQKEFDKHGCFHSYANLSGSVSFGKRSYYYDWEF